MRNVTIAILCLDIFLGGCGGFDSKEAPDTQKEMTVKAAPAPTRKSERERDQSVGLEEESKSLKETFAKAERARKSGKGSSRIVGSEEKLKAQKATTAKFKRGKIHRVARAGDLVSVKKLIAENPEAVNERADDWTKETPIFNAILFAHYDIVDFLLDHGADVNAVAANGRTPLFEALYRQDTTIVRRLLKAGANVNARDWQGKTPLHFLVREYPPSDCIKIFVQHGAKINARDKSGRTPLDYAKWKRKLVQYLESLGAVREGSNEGEWMASLTPEAAVDPKPKLLTILRNAEGRNQNTRIAAAFALYRLGSPNKATVHGLVSLLSRESAEIQISLLQILGSYGVQGKIAMPGIKKLRKASRLDIRLMAALALQQIDIALSPSVPRDGATKVKGHTLHVVHGLPGALSGKPGKPIPPRPVPRVTIYFLSERGVFTTKSDDKGKYEVTLPPGTYELAWRTGGKISGRDFAEPFGRRFVDLQASPYLIRLKENQTMKANIPAIMMFVD